MLLAALIRVVLQGLSLFRFGAGERLGVNVDIEVSQLREIKNHNAPVPFPHTCKGGSLSLQGVYVVEQEHLIPEGCRLQGQGADGATVLLNASLVFAGPEGVTFDGALRFVGQRPLKQACVVVQSQLSVGQHGETQIAFTDCHNEEVASLGGALYVEHGLNLVSGSLEITSSSSRGGGGGIYIHQGDLRQEGGSTKLQDCTSEGSGGGLRIQKGQLYQYAGDINCQSCTARVHGGCLSIEIDGAEGLGINSSGSIEAQSCRADSGGAIAVQGSIRSLGDMAFWGCQADASGGAAWINGSLTQAAGNMEFNSCEATEGGAIQAADLTQTSGSMHFHNCTAVRGGAIHTEKVLLLGMMEFDDCHAIALDDSGLDDGGKGGAVLAREGLKQANGTLGFRHCSAKTGGAIQTADLTQTSGRMHFRNCTAVGGGAIHTEYMQSFGIMEFNDCHVQRPNEGSLSAGKGGAVLANRALDHSNGTLRFHNCTAYSGGAMYSEFMSMSSGTMEFSRCEADLEGGAIHTHDLIQDRGSMRFHNCAAHSGGAIHTFRMLSLDMMEFNNCQASVQGGAIQTADLNQSSGSMHFRNCTSVGGGAIHTEYMQSFGIMEFNNCHARDQGGGVLAQKALEQANGTLRFKNCTAYNGGAIFAGKDVTASGIMAFTGCRGRQGSDLMLLKDPKHANGNAFANRGGVMTVRGDLTSTGSLTFEDCEAQAGSSLAVEGDVRAPRFPDTCAEGKLNLRGLYVVNDKQTIKQALNERCMVHGSSATVLLNAPLVFEAGSRGVAFGGFLTFVGISELAQACVTVRSTLQIGDDGGAHVTFTDCHNKEHVFAGGALNVEEGLTVVSGTLEIARSSSVAGGGGLHIANGDLQQDGGRIKLWSSATKGSGGGLRIQSGGLHQHSGEISCRNCSAEHNGGCLAIEGEIKDVARSGVNSSGSITAEGCTAASGGAMAVHRSVWSFGNMIFKGCRAVDSGGAAVISDSLTQDNGTMSFDSCAALKGGALMIQNKFAQADTANMYFRNCTAETDGGAVLSQSSFISSGIIEFNDCRALEAGGALNAIGNISQEAGHMKFESCRASSGGAISSVSSLESSGVMEFSGCQAQEGGALMIQNKFAQADTANMYFRNCTAETDGGAILVGGDWESLGQMEFNGCNAHGYGGAVFGDFQQIDGLISFASCSASRGGAASVQGDLNSTGRINIRECHSDEGPALAVQGAIRVPDFPETCTNGVLDLQGLYAIKHRTATLNGDGSCRVLGTGATILLSAPLTFPGRGGVVFRGTLTFGGTTPMPQACVTAHGPVRIEDGSDGSSHIVFVDCHNNGLIAGGALFLGRGLTMMSGALEIWRSSSSSSDKGGGGLYILRGGLRQEGGSIKLQSSRSEAYGGGLMIVDGGLLQLAGNISCQNCSAKSGGCLAVSPKDKRKRGLRLKGSITARSCKATQGGAIFVQHGNLRQDAGSITILFGHSELVGGGIYMHGGSLEQHAGSISCQSCAARDSGGCMHMRSIKQLSSPKQLYLNGTFHAENCSAKLGGAIFVTENALLSGMSQFTDCHADAQTGGSGGAMFTRGSLTSTGTTVFRGCRSHEGGAAWVGRNFIQSGGLVTFASCRAYNSGGGAYVTGKFLQRDGRLLCEACSGKEGGCLLLTGVFEQFKGTFATFTACKAKLRGGAIFTNNSLTTSGTTIFDGCHSGEGGAARVEGNFTQAGGTIRFDSCRADSSGGGAAVTGNFSQQDGHLLCQACSGQGGGCLSVAGIFEQLKDAFATFSACSALARGGALKSFKGIVLGGSATFQNCSSGREMMMADATLGDLAGGCLHTSRNVEFRGHANFTGCSTTGDGGGLAARQVVSLTSANVIFANCTADGEGGGAFMESGFMLQDANVQFHFCHSGGSGGGMRVGDDFIQQGGSLSLDSCKASKKGGGLHISGRLTQKEGSITKFRACEAEQSGGGMDVLHNIILAGSADFQNCAAEEGGGVHAHSSLFISGNADFKGCSARGGGGGGAHATSDLLLQTGGSLSCNACRGNVGGCLHVLGRFDQQRNASGTFKACTAARFGGALAVKSNVTMRGSSKFVGCASGKRHGPDTGRPAGGCLHTLGHAEFSGSVQFLQCSTGGVGGGVAAHQVVSLPGANAFFADCTAEGEGGGVFVDGSFIQQESKLEFKSCTGLNGGGMLVGGDVIQKEGFLFLNSCKATRSGGGLSTNGSFTHEKGSVTNFRSCRAGRSGGGMDVLRNITLAGSAEFQTCAAERGSGGGLHANGNLFIPGTADFKGCWANDGGGGAAAHSANISGSCQYRKCIAAGISGGGGMRLHGSFLQVGGRSIFKSCGATSGPGGGLHMSGNFSHMAGELKVHDCEASANAGGGIAVKQHVSLESAINVSHCRAASGGAGIAVDGTFTQQGGTARVMKCMSATGSGGGIRVEQSFVQKEGKLLIKSCASSSRGGCLDVVGHFYQRATAFTRFKSCRALAGGCVSVAESMKISGSNSFDGCTASGAGGGCLHVQRNFSQHRGTVTFTGCQTLIDGGGGLQVKGNLTAHAGNMTFQSCKAGGDGGGVDAWGNVRARANASLIFNECMAGKHGGGMSLSSGNFFQHSAKIHFRRCEAHAGYGGGLAVPNGHLMQDAGNMQFTGCSADAGGGLFVQQEVMILRGMVLAFKKCKATRGFPGGGGMYISHGLLDLHGHLSFKSCSSFGSGGGLLIDKGGVRQGNESLLQFFECSALGAHGGGMATDSLDANGTMVFHDCTASHRGGNGGGLYIKDGHGVMQQPDGHMSFVNCTAGGYGGGLYAGSNYSGGLANVSLDHCTSETDAGNLYAASARLNLSNLAISEPRSADFDIISSGELTLNSLSLQSMNRKFGLKMRAHSLHADSVYCTSLKFCSLDAPDYHVANLHCPPGTGVRTVVEGGQRCAECGVNHTQIGGIINDTKAECVKCPVENDFCYANEFKMKPGHMVDPENISFTFYCPNPSACPGGNSSNLSLMCADGYEGKSCANCSMGYAISDSSVLLCTRCPKTWRQKALQWLSMLGKHVLPFALAAKSALAAPTAREADRARVLNQDSVQEEAKRSAVLINQLLSFATVTGGLLTIVAQTNAVREIKNWAVVLEICGATTWLMGGEGPSEGFGGFGVSSLCLLTDLGLSGKLWQAHLLHTVISLALVFGLMAFRRPAQHGLVVVVGLNCFWPGIFSYFGKYLYCYQFAPESAAIKREDTYDCPFTDSLGQRIALRIVMLVVFLVVALVWISLSLFPIYKKGDEGDKDPPLHVIFLSRAYRQSCRLWESERLMRKTLLTLAVSALPITSSPALQLVCVLGVVVVSLFLYAALLPYKTMRFNLTECTLLATAALMTGIVSCLTAYDDYWGRVLQVEFLLIFTMVGLVVVTCFVMMFMIYLELRREWRNRPVPKEDMP